MIRLLTLGGLAVQRRTDEGVDAPRTSGKRNALLAYLAVERPNGSHSRDTLLALFWPESDDKHARDSLKQLVRSLRQELGDDVFSSERGSGIALDDARVWCDAVELNVAAEQGEHERVLELYRGDFLEGFHLNGSVEFEDWAEGQRRRLQERAVISGKLLAEGQERDGDHGAAIRTMRRLQELKPYDESCLRTLMRLHLDAGERAQAVAAYEVYAELIATDFDTSPSLETVALLERARTRVVVRGERKVVVIDRTDEALDLDAPTAAADVPTASADDATSLPGGLESSQGREAGPRAWRRRPVLQGAALLGAGMLLAAAGMSVWSAWGPDTAPAEVIRFTIDPPESAGSLQLGGVHQAVVISPDGKLIAYRANTGATAGPEINMWLMEEGVVEPLPDWGSADDPFFSPEGEWVGFARNPGDSILQKASTSGGEPMTLATTPFRVRGASWGPDDRIIFGTDDGGLFRVSGNGEEPELLTTLDAEQVELSHRWPSIIPGREAVVFVVQVGAVRASDNGRLAVLDLSTGETKRLGLSGTSPRYVSTGHLLYVDWQGTLQAVRFDLGTLEPTSTPLPLIEGVAGQVSGNGTGAYSVSDNGHLVYVGGRPPAPRTPLRQLVWVDRQGREEPLPMPPRIYVRPRLSPDGGRIAVGVVREAEAAMDLWVYDAATGGGIRLTYDDFINRIPMWTPDGQDILFSSTKDRGAWPPHTTSPFVFWGHVNSVAADGSGAARRLGVVEENQAATGMTPDGRLLVYTNYVDNGSQWEIMAMPVDGSADPTALKSGPFKQAEGTISPDGRWLAYQSNESGISEIYVEPFPGPGARVPVSIGGADGPVWSHDSRELFYHANGGMLTAATISGGAVPQVDDRTPLFSIAEYQRSNPVVPRMYHVAPDGRFLLIRELPVESADAEAPPPQINVVLNWFEELRERVPN